MTGFSDEQILELCYIAHPWAQEMIDKGECTKEEQDEFYMENPVGINWSYENIGKRSVLIQF